MARSRNIKPQFFKNEDLAELDAWAQLLFIGLWTLADRNGVLEDRPKRIKAEVFPYRHDVDVPACLDQLASAGFIKRYEFKGSRYIFNMKFPTHQNPHQNEDTAFDVPKDIAELIAGQRGKKKRSKNTPGGEPEPLPEQHESNPADSLLLIPDSGIPLTDSSAAQRDGDGGDGETLEPEAPPATPADVLSAWNGIEGVRHAQKLSDGRRKSLNARLKDPFFKDKWREGIERVRGSPYCKGGGNRGWVADFDWFIAPESLIRLLEGKYDELFKTNGAGASRGASAAYDPGKAVQRTIGGL